MPTLLVRTTVVVHRYLNSEKWTKAFVGATSINIQSTRAGTDESSKTER